MSRAISHQQNGPNLFGRDVKADGECGGVSRANPKGLRWLWSLLVIILLSTDGTTLRGAIIASAGPCYLGDPFATPGGNLTAPIGLQVCNFTDGTVFSGRAAYYSDTFWWVNSSRSSFDALNPSSARSALLYILSMGEVPSPGFIALLNLSNPELVCGTCVCAICNGTVIGPNTTVVNPNVTLNPTLYRGGPWFPYPNGSLPGDTPVGWSIANTYSRLGSSCKMPASPVIANEDAIVMGMNNISICGGCIRLSEPPDFLHIHSTDPCLRTGYGQTWDSQAPPLWTELDLTQLNCSIYPRFKWTSAGWFNGYSSEAICVQQSNAIPFGCLPVGTGYYATDRWCPRLSMTLDPVLCNRSGVFDRACTRQFYAGQQVNGDTLFCSQYGCNVNSQCVCSFMDIESVEQFELNGTWVASPTITIAMGVETSESNTIRPRMPSMPSEEESMFLSVFDDVLKIVYLDAADRTISLSKSGMSDWFFCQTKVCTRTLQDATFLSSGFVNVMSISAVNKTASGRIWVTGRSSCYRYDCTFCPEDLKNFECLDTGYQIILVLGIICMGLVAILLLALVLVYGAAVIMWMLRKLTGIFWATPIGENTGNGMKNFFNMFVPRTATSMAILLSLCLCVNCCDRVYVQQTNLSSCVEDVSGLFENCEMAMDMQITLPYLGSTACLQLKDEKGGDIVFMEISYESARMELDYALRYYTSSFEVSTESKLRCSAKILNSGCNPSVCRSGNITRDGQGNLIDPMTIMYPGMTYCDVAFAGSLLDPWPHCLFSDDCFYSGFGIVPRGTVYSVSELVRERVSSVLKLNVTGGSGVIEASLDFNSNPNIIYGDYTMSFTVSEVASKLSLSQLSLVASVSNDTGFKAYLSQTSAVNQPVGGTVGDIQANTANVLTGEIIPGVADLAYDPAIVLSRSFHDRGGGGHVSVDWMFQKPGIGRIATVSGAELPGLYEGTPLKFITDNVLWYPLDSTPTAVLSLSGPSVIVSRSISSVCPTFSILEGSGCRSCSKGASIVLSAKSSCLAGTAIVSTKSENVEIQTPIAYVSEDYMNVTVRIKTNESKVTVDICLTATTSECHEITFQTLEVTSGELVNQTSQVTTVTGGDEPSDDSWFMFKWIGDLFEGVGKWWQSLLAIMFWIGMLILLVVLTWFTFPIWWPITLALVTWCRRMIGKIGAKVSEKSAVVEEVELPVIQKSSSSSEMLNQRASSLSSRNGRKKFAWE